MVEAFDDDVDDEDEVSEESNAEFNGEVMRIGPGRPRISFDLRCPVCGDKARTPELVSPAIDDDGTKCPYDKPGARWMEWHECVCCGEWYSILNSN
jgi:hypothetical protein